MILQSLPTVKLFTAILTIMYKGAPEVYSLNVHTGFRLKTKFHCLHLLMISINMILQSLPTVKLFTTILTIMYKGSSEVYSLNVHPDLPAALVLEPGTDFTIMMSGCGCIHVAVKIFPSL